jgi:hypothetical protein
MRKEHRMKKGIVLTVVLLVAAWFVGVANADVQSFVDRIKAANPVDRWMPSGTIQFTMSETETGQPGGNSYVMAGSVVFDADHLLFKRQYTIGQPTCEPTREGRILSLARDLELLIEPGGFMAYVPSLKRMSVHPNGMLTVDGFSLLREGVLTKRFLSPQFLATCDLRLVGNQLHVSDKGGQLWTITADAQGRLMTSSYDSGSAHREWQYNAYKQVAGRWVPGELTVRMTADGRERTSHWTLDFQSGEPASDEFVISPDSETIISTFATPGQNPARTVYATGNTKPRSRPTKLEIFNYAICAERMPFYETPCSPPNENGQCDYWGNFWYIRLGYTTCAGVPSPLLCIANYDIVLYRWPCISTPWNPEYPCGPDPYNMGTAYDWVCSWEE